MALYKHYQATTEHGLIKDVLIEADTFEVNDYDPCDYFNPGCSTPEFVQDVELGGDYLPDILESS